MVNLNLGTKYVNTSSDTLAVPLGAGFNPLSRTATPAPLKARLPFPSGSRLLVCQVNDILLPHDLRSGETGNRVTGGFNHPLKPWYHAHNRTAQSTKFVGTASHYRFNALRSLAITQHVRLTLSSMTIRAD